MLYKYNTSYINTIRGFQYNVHKSRECFKALCEYNNGLIFFMQCFLYILYALSKNPVCKFDQRKLFPNTVSEDCARINISNSLNNIGVLQWRLRVH